MVESTYSTDQLMAYGPDRMDHGFYGPACLDFVRCHIEYSKEHYTLPHSLLTELSYTTWAYGKLPTDPLAIACLLLTLH